MPTSFFPLRWESTGEQWWYASPIDCAGANGHYDLVRELLYIDTNLLIKLTSLRRIRRLETVWDDHDQFKDVAKCRAYVAKKLLLECETNAGHNSLIRAGYGGWLLYTAASAGDVGFVQDLLKRDPLVVFGEGEYGITDILYAAARSKSSEVFKLLMNSAIGMRSTDGGKREEGGEFCDGFRWEMMNRAVHCAARGGNLEVLKELLVGCSDVLAYRDAQGSTILHSAAGRGQVKEVENLLSSYNIIDTTDHQGNTALHIAAYKGFFPVVETLLVASPSLASSTNKEGNTFLHMAVAGFQTPGFHRIDQQLELVRQLVGGKIINIQDIINSRNNQGRTALHLAVAENIQSNVVELLMTVPSVDLNIRDSNGMTPADLLKQHPQGGSSKLLIKQMVAAGGSVSYREDKLARGALAAHLKLQGCVGNSPGASFRVPDSEIFIYAGNEDGKANNNSEASCSDDESVGLSECSDDVPSNKRPKNSMNSASVILKLLLQWPKRKEKGTHEPSLFDRLTQSLDQTPTPLRQRFSGNTIPDQSPSHSGKKKFTVHSPRSPFSRSSMSSPASVDKAKGVHMRTYTMGSPWSSEKSFDVSGGKPKPFKRIQSPFNKKMMNHYVCFKAQGLSVEDSISCKRPGHFKRNSIL